MSRQARAARLLLATSLGGLLAVGGVGTATGADEQTGDDEAHISYVEPSDEGLRVLVSVPVGARVDLEGVTATVAGDETTATAAPTGETTTVRRTTVLAMDTSMSMSGQRFAAARAAATTFLGSVPDDVEVGIVTFDGDVDLALAPSTDRDEARAVIDSLTLSRKTLLYDGVLEAVDALGDEGQRDILLLSDGADTSDTALTDATRAVRDADVRLDAVALEQAAREVAPLRALASAGSGDVISADANGLRSTFAQEAEALARQVLVTIPVPDSVTSKEAEVEVVLPTDAGMLSASAYVAVAEAGASAPDVAVATEQAARALPGWAMYTGIGGLGVGILLALLLLVPRRSLAPSAADRINQYAGSATGGSPARGSDELRVDANAALSVAKDATASVLRRTWNLEQKIQGRLEGAGSDFKPAEWMLLQIGVFLLSGLVGLLVGRGSLVLGIVFLLGGAIAPWMYLGRKRSKRFKAFGAGLPDTLSLLSGSLAAGLSLAQSVDTIVREGSEPIAGEFRRVLAETRLGVPLEDALEGVAERFASDDFAWVVMAIKIQRQVGGNLAELLDTVAATMRERQYLLRQVRSLSAEGRLSAYILAALPPLFLLYLLLTQRDYVMPLFTEPVGWVILGTAAVLLVAGSLWMKKVVSVEV